MLRILVVDDDADLRMLYRSRLEGAGHVVQTSATALGAIALLTESWYDLVLLDYLIDGTLTGLEVSRYIRRRAEKTGLPAPACFLITGHALSEIVGKATAHPLEGISFIFHKGTDNFDTLWRHIDDMNEGVKT